MEVALREHLVAMVIVLVTTPLIVLIVFVTCHSDLTYGLAAHWFGCCLVTAAHQLASSWLRVMLFGLDVCCWHNSWLHTSRVVGYRNCMCRYVGAVPEPRIHTAIRQVRSCKITCVLLQFVRVVNGHKSVNLTSGSDVCVDPIRL